MERRQLRKMKQLGSHRFRWLVASGLLHAILLGGLVFILGTDTGPAATLRARLVTVITAVSAAAPERQPLAAAPAVQALPSLVTRARKAPGPPSPPVPPVVSPTTESSPGRPVLPQDTVREMASSPVASALSLDAPKGDSASSAPAGPIGEGLARSFVPQGGPLSSQVESDSAGRDAESPPSLGQPEGARGVFLIPAGSGSGGGTGQAGSGAADHGIGMGGGGTGGSGEGKTGQAGPAQMGGGPARFASKGGQGGDRIGDLLRSIRHRIEQNKIYPDAARQEGIQGTVELRFRIAQDGSVEAIEILRSSGSNILDEASRQTLRRAAPYPVVRGWIRLPLSYRLDR